MPFAQILFPLAFCLGGLFYSFVRVLFVPNSFVRALCMRLAGLFTRKLARPGYSWPRQQRVEYPRTALSMGEGRSTSVPSSDKPEVWDVSFPIPLMPNLASVINQLEQERNRLSSQLESLNSALSALNVKGSSRRGGISAAGRARIAAAQRARWARATGKKVISIRRMSPAARRRIAAAQKARWAKWRKAQKAG